MKLSIFGILLFGMTMSVHGAATPGVWGSNLAEAEALSKSQNIPLILMMGSKDCHYCQALKRAFNGTTVKPWLSAQGFAMAQFETATREGLATKYRSVVEWFKQNGATGGSIPKVGVSYPDGAGGFKTTTFIGRGANDTEITEAELKAKLDEILEPYFDLLKGPTFLVGDTIGNRLEAQVGYTTKVNVYLTRAATSKVATVKFRAVNKSGAVLIQREIRFEAGVQTVSVPVAIDGANAIGDQITLALLNAKGEVTATSHITFVQRENSPKNPTWRGVSDFGEWTMDIDAAMKFAADYERTHTGEKAYRLALVGGSMWCPDCAKTDRYLIDTPQFGEWAKGHKVVCISVDIPNWSATAPTGPCLLTREVKDVNETYMAADPDHGPQQSGAGYLSRWMIPDEEAAAQLQANQALIARNTLNGGWNRPERTNQYRTGVPIFILLNADGSIAGRFETFASTSPTEFKPAYLDRLNDLLATDGGSDAHLHWKTASDSTLDVQGGRVSGSLSSVDASQYWKLVNRTEWVEGDWTVKAESGVGAEENVALSLWSVEDGVATKIATKSGNLKTGVTLGNGVVPAQNSVDYFLQVEALTASGSFNIEHVGSTVVAYALSSRVRVNPGRIQFSKSSATVTENEAKKAGGVLKVYASLARTGGATGATNVIVSVDASASTAMPDRYELKTASLAWADGEMGAKSVEIDVLDDANADGTESVVLRAGDSTFTLTIEDNDKTQPGILAIDRTEPNLAKSKTLIAREGTTVRIGVSRIEGASGDVSAQLTATGGRWNETGPLQWSSRAGGTIYRELTLPRLSEFPKGKLTVSLANLSGGVKTKFATKTLTIQLIDETAPAFAVDSAELSLTRAVAMSPCVIPISGLHGGTVRVKKLSGSLPSGIKVAINQGALTVSGVPTKAGSFTAVYQVTEKVNARTLAGLTVSLRFTVVDVATLDPADPRANPFVKTTRKLADMMVVDAATKQLTGILSDLSIASTGKLRAKYKCQAGTISFTSKNWATVQADGTLTAVLTSTKKGYQIDVTVPRDGCVTVELVDPNFDGTLTAEAAQLVPDPENWKGTYTLAFHGGEMTEFSESRPCAWGDPILTLTMKTSTAIKKGLVSYTGVLPNGQSMRGSSTLIPSGVDSAILPIYYRSTKDFFTGAIEIRKNHPARAISEISDQICCAWIHTEKGISSALRYPTVWGSAYDGSAPLKTVAPEHVLVSRDATDLSPIAIDITSSKVQLVPGLPNPAKAKIRLTKSSGLVTGTFKTRDSKGNLVTATYKGVLLQDWGDGCPTCGEVPWMTGSFWFTDRGLSTKCGDIIYLESESTQQEN